MSLKNLIPILHLSRFTNTIRRYVQELSLVSGIHSLETRVGVERVACGATRELTDGDILDLAR
jgi:hypothetical protein